MAGASQRDGNPGASSQRQSLLRRLENREQLAAQTREQPTRPLAADSRGGTVPNRRKRSLEEALDDARHNKQQSTSRGDRERGRQKGDGQTKPVITHEFDHLVLNCKQDPRAVEVYIGRSSRGAARLDFRDCSWGNYKYPLPPQSTPVQRQAAVDGHRRDLLDDVETMQRVRLQLRGRRLGCWCAPEPCHGHNLSWVANCEERVFRQLLRAAPPSRDLGSGRRGWDPGG